MIRAVFLDIDDTILDFGAFVRETMASGFRHFGLPQSRNDMYPVFRRVNNALWQQMEQGEITRGQLFERRWQAIFRELGIQGDGRAFELYFRDALLHSAIPVPGADEIIPWLSRQFIL
ncbi:MAG: HAD family hydrolase, partial [Clostridia bacterium]|nr:HAD family hydrolase [Clostridia bacterium]